MQQDKALAILKSGQNVFLTGSAGSGKTYVLNQYIKYLRARKVSVAITASTGIAATHIGGQTIHSFSGMGIKDNINSSDLALMKTKKYLLSNLENTDVLIIDEISMLHKKQLDIVHKIFKYFKENNEAFGGIQVVLTGDFFQLPPITRNEERNRDKFAFMSEAWLEANFQICYLTQQFRQSDNSLNRILNEVRSNTIQQESIELLHSTVNNEIGDTPTRLYTHNVDVDRTNNDFLSQLEGKAHSFKAKTKGNSKLVDLLAKSVLTSSTLQLKENTKVMFIKNNLEKGYVNGTQGVVTGFDEDSFPIVKTHSGKQILAEPEAWTIEDEKGRTLASYHQVPLRLAWAITVHKSQGMTLDTAEIDLSGSFEKGQGYVALSRVKSLEGLRLKGLNTRALEVDMLALKADIRFAELSQEADDNLKDEDLEKSADQFLDDIGALKDPEAIRKHEKKISGKKGPKKSTYIVTKELVESGKNLKEISEERGLSEVTIIGHLNKLKESHPDLNISAFKPDNATLILVGKACKDVLKKNNDADFTQIGKLKLSAIHKMLNGKLGYDELNLAMLFI